MTQLPMEPQAGVVREIISRVAQGQAIPQIIRELEGRGVPAPRGGPRWSWSVVNDIARNPAYIGKPNVDEDERVAWAPLVPEQLFFNAQRALEGPSGPSAGYPAFGLLLCAIEPCHGVFASCLQAVS
ncbi:recombinase family protein [Actinomadura opuntiae]|uniref:recombinase family protein n=1 Tax=Actinomadura sp. OS1-43 TaxID=604315 RepID=UPI00255AA0E6|nr:recombinase family protein [Actinomadura sp. OS1-43]MDL4814285.1 recombinase family protein [Actinomadura sp. OS1-43]